MRKFQHSWQGGIIVGMLWGGTMPLGYAETNGRPFGACIISSAGGEAKILKAMHAW